MNDTDTYYSAESDRHQASLCYNENNLDAALAFIRRSICGFTACNDTNNVFRSKALELHYLHKLYVDSKEFYSEHESLVQNFLSEFHPFHNEREYVTTYYNYLHSQYQSLVHQRDYIIAYEVGNQLLDYIENRRSFLAFIKDNQIRIIKARLKGLEAQISSMRQDDFEVQAELYREASRLSSPGDLDDYFTPMLRKKHEYLSMYYKLKAIGVRRKSQSPDLNKVAEYFGKALLEAEEAEKIMSHNSDRKHILYITYLFESTVSRAQILKRDFESAIAHLNNAIISCKHLSDIHINVFPNYYIDLSDLQDERMIISASNAFAEHQYSKCSEVLAKWLDKKKPADMQWRYSSVQVRALAASTLEFLQGVLDNEKENEPDLMKLSVRKLEEALYPITSPVHLGRATNKIIEELMLIVNSYQNKRLTKFHFDACTSAVLDLFPIEAFLESNPSLVLANIETPNHWDLVPECFYQEYHRLELTRDWTSKLDGVRQLIKAYLVLIADYHYHKIMNIDADYVTKLPSTFDSDFLNMDLGTLVSSVFQLISSFDKYWNNSILILNVLSDVNPDNPDNLIMVKVENIIRTLHKRYFPQIMRINAFSVLYENNDRTVNNDVIFGTRVWKQAAFKSVVFDSSWPLVQNNYYYFSPKWKNLLHAQIERYSSSKKLHKIWECRIYDSVLELLKKSSVKEREKDIQRRISLRMLILADFEELITNDTTSNWEYEIKRRLYQNQWMFGSNVDDVAKERTVTNKGRRADFVLKLKNKEQIIFEVKLPNVTLLRSSFVSSSSALQPGTDYSFTRELIDDIEQLRVYLENYSKDNNLTNTELKGLLLIGRTPNTEELRKELKNLENRHQYPIPIRIKTYDDFVRDIRGDIEHLSHFLTTDTE